MKEIKNSNELAGQLNESDPVWLLLYRGESELSNCALSKLKEFEREVEFPVLYADVDFVKDIHGKYDISSVPSLLYFRKGTLQNVIKGCQSVEFYHTLIHNSAVSANFAKGGRKMKHVLVYTTPTCTYCTAIKNYLADIGVSYREIDVSHDPQAAQDMVRRSGQQGVPQTLIDGRLVIGYDKKKMDELLELN